MFILDPDCQRGVSSALFGLLVSVCFIPDSDVTLYLSRTFGIKLTVNYLARSKDYPQQYAAYTDTRGSCDLRSARALHQSPLSNQTPHLNQSTPIPKQARSRLTHPVWALRQSLWTQLLHALAPTKAHVEEFELVASNSKKCALGSWLARRL
jgi:hypothetical protein